MTSWGVSHWHMEGSTRGVAGELRANGVLWPGSPKHAYSLLAEGLAGVSQTEVGWAGEVHVSHLAVHEPCVSKTKKQRSRWDTDKAQLPNHTVLFSIKSSGAALLQENTQSELVYIMWQSWISSIVSHSMTLLRTKRESSFKLYIKLLNWLFILPKGHWIL